MEEIFDIYTRDGKYLGTELKSVCHSSNPGFYHKPVWIWIVNSNGEILVQKRAFCKKNNPNKWDMPSAGHVLASESSLAGAVRETKEELGIDTTENDYEFICEYISDNTFEIGQVYLLKKDLDINDLKLQENEVAEVKWYSFDQFKKLLYSDQFVKHDDEYKDIVIKMLGDR